MDKPRHIELLETLNVFGIRADYMAQFREFLEDEGLPPDQDADEFVLPVLRNLGTHKLKVIRLKPEINGVQTAFGTAYRQLAPVPELAPPQGEDDQWLLRNKVQLNWYPKIQAMKAAGLAGGDGTADLEHGKLGARHVALLDIDHAWLSCCVTRTSVGGTTSTFPVAPSRPYLPTVTGTNSSSPPPCWHWTASPRSRPGRKSPKPCSKNTPNATTASARRVGKSRIWNTPS